MKINLYFTPEPLNDTKLRGKTAIVIDILRASSSICTAIANGCREIIPTASQGDAGTLRANLDRELVLMCGERDGIKIEGFDLGNSPAEYTSEIVKDKILIFTSTNGSQAIIAGAAADNILICSFLNIDKTAAHTVECGEDVAIVCAGDSGGFSLEDTLCGGYLVSQLIDSGYEIGNDAAQTALDLKDKRGVNLTEAIKNADHGKDLIKLGAGSDIDLVCNLNTLSVVPHLQEGKIVNAIQRKEDKDV